MNRRRSRDTRNGHWIYRPWYVHPKTGKTIRACDYGHKAFRLWVPNRRSR